MQTLQGNAGEEFYRRVADTMAPDGWGHFVESHERPEVGEGNLRSIGGSALADFLQQVEDLNNLPTYTGRDS